MTQSTRLYLSPDMAAAAAPAHKRPRASDPSPAGKPPPRRAEQRPYEGRRYHISSPFSDKCITVTATITGPVADDDDTADGTPCSLSITIGPWIVRPDFAKLRAFPDVERPCELVCMSVTEAGAPWPPMWEGDLKQLIDMRLRSAVEKLACVEPKDAASKFCGKELTLMTNKGVLLARTAVLVERSVTGAWEGTHVLIDPGCMPVTFAFCSDYEGGSVNEAILTKFKSVLTPDMLKATWSALDAATAKKLGAQGVADWPSYFYDRAEDDYVLKIGVTA